MSSLSSKTLSSTSSPPMATPYSNSLFAPAMAIIIGLLMVSFLLVSLFALYMGLCVQSGRFPYRRSPLWRPYQQPATGLDPSTIAALPVFSFSSIKGLKQGRDSRECSVCLTEFVDDEKVRVLPKCGHAFHPSCIDMWLASHSTCPVCRKSLICSVPGEPNFGDGRSNQPLAERDSLQQLENQHQGLFMDTHENPQQFPPQIDPIYCIKIDDQSTSQIRADDDEGTSEIRQHASTQDEKDTLSSLPEIQIQKRN